MQTGYRPINLGMRLSKAEDAALRFLSETEGMPKSTYLRRALRMAINEHAAVLPPQIIKAITAQQHIEA